MSSKSCLILSQGPVQTPEHPQVEGGGLRCWGLAKGVHANDPSIDVTVAYHGSYRKPEFTEKYQGINIATWNLDTLPDLISQFDSVIVSYCMGDLSVQVARNIRRDQQLILDCYVPIYVEVSARQSANVEDEFRAFEIDVERWKEVLRRGDVFMCANPAQKEFYRGVLAAVGRINPVTYGDDMIKIIPYGVYRDEPKPQSKPIEKLFGGKKDVLKIMWFGGIYPWFDIRSLIDAVKEVNKTQPAKLVVVGAKNPFNTHPDFIARYEEFMEYASRDDVKDYVVVQDWIRYDDRADWYLDADIVVVFNKEGEENKLAWRTRVVDYMWADLPILTNGGDPLGEVMLAHNAAHKMKSLETADIAAAITDIAAKGTKYIDGLRKNMHKLKADYYWDVATAELSKAIAGGTRARDLEKMGVPANAETSTGSRITVRRVVGKAKKVPAYARKYGYRTTAMVMSEMVRRKVRTKVPMGRKSPAYVFVSHQLDMSGAPFIVMDMAMEFKAAGKPVEFYTYLPVHKENLAKLRAAGIRPRVLMKKEMVPQFMAGDTLILNTVAHSEAVKEAAFSALNDGSLKQVIWYLHEDHPELLFRPDEQKRIGKLLEKGKIVLLIPAQQILKNYTKYFNTKTGLKLLPYRHKVPAKYHRELKPKDFADKLTFVLPGTVSDGRKGQLPIFYALLQFYKQFYVGNEKKYRDFELVLIGLSTDFLSRQLKGHAKSLGKHFSHHGKVTWTEDLDLVAKGNVTICYSIREALPLFVFEGMMSGHVVLRNDSSGMEEQLVDGKNGWYLATDDFDQVVAVFEEILNKSKTSDAKLSAMSHESYVMARKQEDNSYLAAIEEDA